MKRYLVGGAVRDALLGLQAREQDWVVVGASPEDMVAAGYRPVGKDFPVFLHPETKEEHALARTERKSGRGYHGFTFHTGPEVTLEEDLIRRDLTINAIARDDDGRLVDPYGGQRDLQARVLRHVSPAFAEDPLRVLRLARFAARFAPLGFSVAPETLALCRRLVNEGEIDHLVAERVWKETERALMQTLAPPLSESAAVTPAQASRPSVYFEILRACGALARLFPELEALFGVPQRADYHPEVDSGVHTLMCIDAAARLGFGLEVRVAALCHDYGKALTLPSRWPSHHGHDLAGLPLVERFCERLRVPKVCREVALIHTREHLLVHQVRQLRAKTLLELLERMKAFKDERQFALVCEACLCDARGRLGYEDCDYPQLDYLRAAAAEAAQLQARAVMAEGIVGAAIGPALAEMRTARLGEWLSRQRKTTSG
ncbi:multifunctional CCA addition/repair protein [Stagnimonas aquatica]|uniref:Multifunctional CCA protein n=1 Tax=Stagnimonas aquatica TaxID=2689987 RepID=A0A3N0VKB4_9GAMM|nr:multifunctional CCA addition/repair protein [Stagnimonas aquatica]ROH93150.1 multifunctional CCA addition/repair protein [Stagnimonas aquatica]